jgi:flagellar motor switch protein FliN
MAPKKASKDTVSLPATDLELDQAIDDLRGVLKQDAEGTTASDFGGDLSPLGMDDLSAFGGDFGADAASDTAFGGSDFGSTDFPDTGFDGGLGLGLDGPEPAPAFGGTDFGAIAAPSAIGSGLSANHDLIMDIPIDVQIVLGQSRMQVSGLMNLTEGATIALDRRIGEPVEIVVNGRLIGRGEITILEEDETRFGVKITDVKGARKV